jgi:hypothetical protein
MKCGLKCKTEQGAKRVIRKFLWLPLKLEGQVRWLETANIRQVCDYRRPKGYESMDVVTDMKYFWDDVEWVDVDDSYKKTVDAILLSEPPE